MFKLRLNIVEKFRTFKRLRDFRKPLEGFAMDHGRLTSEEIRNGYERSDTGVNRWPRLSKVRPPGRKRRLETQVGYRRAWAGGPGWTMRSTARRVRWGVSGHLFPWANLQRGGTGLRLRRSYITRAIKMDRHGRPLMRWPIFFRTGFMLKDETLKRGLRIRTAPHGRITRRDRLVLHRYITNHIAGRPLTAAR